MSTYTVVTGDTLESIARRLLGDDKLLNLIKLSNPQLDEENLLPGTVITVPDEGLSPQVSGPADINEVALTISGKRFRFWESMRLSRAIDTIDSIEFTAPFDNELLGFRETFKPFSYQPVTISVGGELLFTGTLLNVSPVVEGSKKTVSVSCYAKPGVLSDCTMPASAFPLEFDGVTLQGIANVLLQPFGIEAVFLGEPGTTFERVALDPGKKVLEFLAELAKQRNLIIASDGQGRLVFQQASIGSEPVANLEQGASPLLTAGANFSPQEYYSHITGLEPAMTGLPGAKYTVQNPLLKSTLRPLNFTGSDTQNTDIKQAVQAKLGRMFGNMATYDLTLMGWRTPAGALWSPNTKITLLAPGAMVYERYPFIIRRVVLSRDSVSFTTSLELALPGSFSEEIPEGLPWDA